jgi:hypothetical protein
VLVCLPWLAQAEWHAFSVYAHPIVSDHSCVCIAVAGDWTRALHSSLARPTQR